MGSPHHYKGHIIQWMFDDKIRIKFPYDRYDLWTNSFNVVREEIREQDVQLTLF